MSSIQSLYFSPYSSLAAMAARSGAAQQSAESVRGVGVQDPIDEISKLGKQSGGQEDQNSLNLKPGELASPAGDILSLSEKAKEADAEQQERLKSGRETEGDEAVAAQQGATSSAASPEKELTQEEKEQVQELKSRDTEVRNHEAAHIAAAGQYATSGASYTYQTGPDGNEYAVGGEVSIDISPIAGDPEATIQKAQQVRAAALAPAEPSSQDYKVAANASKMEAEARTELRREQTEKMQQAQNGENGDDEMAVRRPENGPLSQKTNNVASKYLSQTFSSTSSMAEQSRFQAIA